MKGLRLVLLGHLLFFGLWGTYLLTSPRNAEEIWLETVPVDPRDLLAGHYVDLRFQALDPGHFSDCKSIDSVHVVYLRLAPEGRVIQTKEGPRRMWQALECRKGDASPLEFGTWIKGVAEQKGRFLFGIERFYVPETSFLREARSGEVVAKVSVNRRNEARILELVPMR